MRPGPVDEPPPPPDMAPMPPVLLVAIGGAFGAVLRYLAGAGIARLGAPSFPVATLSVNVVGSFAMGVLFVALTRSGQTHLSTLLLTGLLGGFTTFSAFSLEAVTLMEEGRAMAALAYALLSVILSVAALMLGLAAARAA